MDHESDQSLKKFAIVGCGRIALRHAELIGGRQIKGAILVGVSDVKLERAENIGNLYNVPAFSDMHAMMRAVAPDVVVVLTESGNHARHVCDLAQYGADVIVEKPMALTIDDADRMITTCNQHNVKLFVVKQNRFNLPVIKLRQALENGRFGKLILGTVRVRWCRTQQYYDQDPWRGTWEMDGGVLTNQASHHIDLLEWMMGEVQSVFAYSSTALAKIEAEDTATVVLRFANGGLGVIEATTATRPKNLEGSLSILGETGTVEISGFAVNKMRTWEFVHTNENDHEILENYSCNPPDVYGFGHKSYYEHVIDCLTKGSPHLVDGLEGRKSLLLINAIYEAIETQQEVFLKNFPKAARLGTTGHTSSV